MSEFLFRSAQYIIKFGSKLYIHIECIHMGTSCAPLVADLLCFFMSETSCRLFLTIIMQILLKHLTLPQDIYRFV